MVWWPGAGRGLPGVLHCSNSSVLILQAQPASPSAVQATPVSSASTVAPHTLNHPTFPAGWEGRNNKHKESHQAQTNFLITKPSCPPTSRLYWRSDYAIYLYANDSQHWRADFPSQINLIFSHPLLLAIFNRIIVLLSRSCSVQEVSIMFSLVQTNKCYSPPHITAVVYCFVQLTL